LVAGSLNAAKDAADFEKCCNTTEVKKTTKGVENDLILSRNDNPVEDFTTGESVSFVDTSPKINKEFKTKTSKTSDVSAGKAIIKMKEGIEKGKNAVAGDLGATEAAIGAAKHLKKYKSAEEVAEFLDIDEVSLYDLPPEAMANRLIKKLFSQFFTQGWLDCYDNKPTEKLENAQKYVRVLKTLQTSLLQELASGDEDEATLAIVTKTARTLSETGELSSDVLNSIFSAGDIRQSPILRRLITAL
jgi:hypothetical protein